MPLGVAYPSRELGATTLTKAATMRSSTVIALLGGGLLVVAVGAAVLRGTGDATPTAQLANEDAPTDRPSATGSSDEATPQDTASSSPTPTEAATATETATDSQTASPGVTGTALGPTDVQDTPQTGGGAPAMFGAAVTASAVVTGRRQHG